MLNMFFEWYYELHLGDVHAPPVAQSALQVEFLGWGTPAPLGFTPGTYMHGQEYTCTPTCKPMFSLFAAGSHWWIAMVHMRLRFVAKPLKWPAMDIPRCMLQKKAAAGHFLCYTTPARTKHLILCSKCTPNRHKVARACAAYEVLGLNIGPL